MFRLGFTVAGVGVSQEVAAEVLSVRIWKMHVSGDQPKLTRIIHQLRVARQNFIHTEDLNSKFCFTVQFKI